MSTPPFAPPYKALVVADGPERWVEVSADGKQTACATPLTILGFAPQAAQGAPAVERKTKPGVQFLSVPYAEKEEAKRLGAKWDATKKKWYVPAGLDATPFGQWLA